MNPDHLGAGETPPFDNDSGDMRLHVLGVVAWPFQALLLGLASMFRYSGEPGGFLGPQADGPVTWRPDILDLPFLPLLVAGIAVLASVIARHVNPDAPLPDVGRAGGLLCLSAFALSNGSEYAVFCTLLGLWLCAAEASAIRVREEAVPITAVAAVLLTGACLLGAYMRVQRGCSAFEALLIVSSIAGGVASTGWRGSSSRAARLALPAWFTLLLGLSWWTATEAQLNMRLLVMLELSAAFVAGRHAALFR